MHLITTFVWPALVLFTVLLGMDLGDDEPLDGPTFFLHFDLRLFHGDVQKAHELVQNGVPNDLNLMDLRILMRQEIENNSLNVVRYALCLNPRVFAPISPASLIALFVKNVAEGWYGVAKLLLCHPLLSHNDYTVVISSMATQTPGPDPEFIGWCTTWASLIFECRDGETALLDACGPGQFDDKMLNRLLDATFFGCQRHVTQRLAALLLRKYQHADMTILQVTHQAAVDSGLVHVAAFLRCLGRCRRYAPAIATHAIGLADIAPHIHNVIFDFTEQHHQLYEEWHGGPHQRDVEQSMASVADEEHA